jgi:hypothetical protein
MYYSEHDTSDFNTAYELTGHVNADIPTGVLYQHTSKSHLERLNKENLNKRKFHGFDAKVFLSDFL